MYDLVPAAERKRVLNSLVETVKASGNKLSAGFVGTMPTFYVLTDAGYGDLVYEMIKDGWFHMLANGDATTLGESPYAEHMAALWAPVTTSLELASPGGCTAAWPASARTFRVRAIRSLRSSRR